LDLDPGLYWDLVIGVEGDCKGRHGARTQVPLAARSAPVPHSLVHRSLHRAVRVHGGLGEDLNA